MTTLRNLLALAVLLMACALLLSLTLAVEEFRVVQQDVHSFVLDAHKRTNPLLAHLDAAAGELAHASKQLAIASREQQTLMAKSVQVMDSASEAIDGINTDASHIREAAVQSLAELDETTREAKRALVGGEITLREAQNTLRAATAAVNSVDATVNSLEVQATLRSVAATSASAAETSADVQDYVHRRTRPIRFLYRVGDRGLQFGAKIASYIIF